MSLRVITREDSQLYLKRWALRPQRPTNQDGAWRLFLHRFFCGDGDGHHNHPWRWSFSIVLWGSYEEEYFDMGHSAQTRTIRWVNFIPKRRYHRIVKLNGPVWTLFFTGPSAPGWGFWMPGRGHIPWKDRLRERGIL